VINLKQFLGLLGFLFVAAWIAFNFGYAILCLVGAGVFYAIGAVLQRGLDLGDVQSRIQRSQSVPRRPTEATPRGTLEPPR
jgi:drug/metabolite transporter (DMT)-like permease